MHPHDIASILDADKVDIRAGHHCAQPLMDYLKVGNTARASLYLYNDEEDIDAFISSVIDSVVYSLYKESEGISDGCFVVTAV